MTTDPLGLFDAFRRDADRMAGLLASLDKLQIVAATPQPRANRQEQESLKVIPLTEINIPQPWSPERLRRLEENPDFVRRIAAEISVDRASTCWVEPGDIDQMIHLARSTSRGERLYRVADGIHRLNVAKSLGLTHIMAMVDED